MKRIAPSLAILVIVAVLISDLGLIAKYKNNPDVYATMKNISELHYLLLNEWGITFAYSKFIVSLSLLVFWLARFVFPTAVTLLKYATWVYAVAWSAIGLLVMTGINGILQHSSGTAINFFDLSPLLSSSGVTNLLFLSVGVILLPLVLLLIPAFHNFMVRGR